MNKIVLISSLFFCSVAQAFICPKTYQEVRVGYTEQQVLSICGEPASKTEGKKVSRYANEAVEVWSYSSKKYHDRKNYGQVTESPQFNVAFNGEVIASIDASGLSVNSVNACGITITAGETTKSELQSSCGSPTMTSSASQQVPAGRGKASEWVYQFGPYQPKKVLKFFNGKLESIQ